jgi:hypothetical protein
MPTDGSARPSDSVRRHVRKCVESGYTTSAAWDWPAFARVFMQTRQRQDFGLAIGPGAMETLARSLEQHGLAWMLHAVDPGGEIVASHVVLAAPGLPAAMMWVAGVATTSLASGVGPWLMLEVAAEIGRRGHPVWDLCGADLEGVARFKADLGARLEHYFQVGAPLDPWGRLYGLAKRVVRGR